MLAALFACAGALQASAFVEALPQTASVEQALRLS
jgi:hypothetical protein